MQVHVIPNSRHCIAFGKDILREMESEISRRQTFGMTNRNIIQSICLWVKVLYKVKPDSYSERQGNVNEADIRWNVNALI